VAFAGGRVSLAGRTVPATAMVVRLGTQVLRFAPPLAKVRAAVTGGIWRIRARSPRHTVEIEGRATDAVPHILPVPDVDARRVDMRSTQYLVGVLRLRVWRGRRALFDEESPLAGLELGTPGGGLSAAPHGGRPL
jgi:tocopherol cyclase